MGQCWGRKRIILTSKMIFRTCRVLPTISAFFGFLDRKIFEGLSIEALCVKKQSGRAPRLSKENKEAINAVLEEDAPKKYGYNVWDGPSLSDYIAREYGVSLSVRQCQRMFHEPGFSLIRPQIFPSKGRDSLNEDREAFKKKTE